MSHAYHRFWKCHKTLTFCSLLTRCTIPCACHAKQHLNVQKWREHVMFCTVWLWNVLRDTTACTLSTSQLLKVLRSCGVLYIFTWECALRHNGVHFFDISTSKSGPDLVCFVHFDCEMWFGLRTCRFSEPTFRPSGATNHWKNTVFWDFATFSRTWIFFLLRLSPFWSSFFFSSPLFFDSYHLCFSSVHIVETLTSKLPSNIPSIYNLALKLPNEPLVYL